MIEVAEIEDAAERSQRARVAQALRENVRILCSRSAMPTDQQIDSVAADIGRFILEGETAIDLAPQGARETKARGSPTYETLGASAPSAILNSLAP